MAAEGKIDPMHQFTVEPLVPLHLGDYDISFTNSALFMTIALLLIFGFVATGLKRDLDSRPVANGRRVTRKLHK